MPLRARDVVLAVLVAVIWGLAFVATRVGLDAFSPPQLVVLRFVIAAAPALVPPLPALALSLIVDGPLALPRALAAAPAAGVAAALFLGLVATALAYALWGALLRRYPTATVAPFALLVPFVGALSSALVFGERFGPLRLAGMALVLAGLAAIVYSGHRRDEP